mgnify:FL=1
MEKKTLRFSFPVSVALCLFSLWTVAQGETEGQPPVAVEAGADGMVSVPGGEFSMGCNEAVDSECEDDEKPQRKVEVPGFRIDRTEVTVEAYRQCVDAKRCTPPDTGEERFCN